MRCTGARLIVSYDNMSPMRYDMFWCGMRGEDYEWWECDFAPDTEGLYWYYFELSTGMHCTKYLGKESASSKSKISDHSNIEKWQITVYKKSFKTPDKFKGGIIYQIFPDRFAYSGKKHKNVPEDRKIHENTEDIPDWRPNGQGKITNSDYFQGDIEGVIKKLDYLKSLGVTVIYFNPIFEAHENHRYNTADYEKIDPMLGDERDFKHLCKEAKKRGMSVILDGVFSHTGSDSRYFNKNGRYNELGAYNSKDSKYFNWYKFENWPDKYGSWWGITTLPEIKEEEESYLEYITGKNGILRKWLRAGADGWRLDVADELPDLFLDRLRAAVKAEKSDALIIGEVWEDATNKEAYGLRRRYFQGDQLDSVMNYPFKNAILGFLTGSSAESSKEIIESVLENYPAPVINLLMNHIGTHDTERALTVLGGVQESSKERQSTAVLDHQSRERAKKLLKLASLMQYTLPGIPSVYYGDEAGMEGYGDPFNRRFYPWGREDTELIEWYKALGKMRHSIKCLADGRYSSYICENRLFSFVRKGGRDSIFVALNGGNERLTVDIPEQVKNGKTVLGNGIQDGKLALDAYEFSVILYAS